MFAARRPSVVGACNDAAPVTECHPHQLCVWVWIHPQHTRPTAIAANQVIADDDITDGDPATASLYRRCVAEQLAVLWRSGDDSAYRLD
jgi:hypothetical protein